MYRFVNETEKIHHMRYLFNEKEKKKMATLIKNYNDDRYRMNKISYK